MSPTGLNDQIAFWVLLDIFVHYDVSAPANSTSVIFIVPLYRHFQQVLVLKQDFWMNFFFFFCKCPMMKRLKIFLQILTIVSVTASECAWLTRIWGFSSLKLCFTFLVSSQGRYSQDQSGFAILNQVLSRICLFWAPIFRLNGGHEAFGLCCHVLRLARVTSLTKIWEVLHLHCSACKIFDNSQKILVLKFSRSTSLNKLLPVQSPILVSWTVLENLQRSAFFPFFFFDIWWFLISKMNLSVSQ